MKLISLVACTVLTLALAAAPAEAKKKKKKPPLGPVATVSTSGNTISGFADISTAVATCPTGTAVIGGGFSAPLTASSTLVVFDSYRSGPQNWTVSAIGEGGTGAATAIAYCRRTTRPVSEVTGVGAVPAGVRMTGSASATCPAGTRLVGGGFQSTTGDPGSTQVAFPLTNMSTAPSTWSVIGVNNNLPAETVTAHAYCMTGIRAPTLVSASATPTLGSYGSATVASPVCPTQKNPKKKGKKRKRKLARLLSAGGFSTPLTTSPNPLGTISNSSASAGAWQATVVNSPGPTGTLSLTSQGICV